MAVIGGAQTRSLDFGEIDGWRRGRHRRWVDFGKACGGRRRSRVLAVVAGFVAAFSVKPTLLVFGDQTIADIQTVASGRGTKGRHVIHK